MSGLIRVQTVCKGYQQTTLVDKELKGLSWLDLLHAWPEIIYDHLSFIDLSMYMGVFFFGNINEIRILRLTFQRKSALKYRIRQIIIIASLIYFQFIYPCWQ